MMMMMMMMMMKNNERWKIRIGILHDCVEEEGGNRNLRTSLPLSLYHDIVCICICIYVIWEKQMEEMN